MSYGAEADEKNRGEKKFFDKYLKEEGFWFEVIIVLDILSDPIFSASLFLDKKGFKAGWNPKFLIKIGRLN